MSQRQIRTSSVLKKDLRKVPRAVQDEAWRIAQVLSDDVFDDRLDIRKLHGYKKDLDLDDLS